jgi:hypothetical protein
LFQFDDSHTVFIPPTRPTRVDYGWHMAMIGDVPLVTGVDPHSDAAAKGLAAGDRVLLLNTIAPSRSNRSRLAYFYRFIRPGAQQRIAVLSPDGSARTIDVVSHVDPKRTADVGDLLDDLELLLDRARDRSAPVGDVLVWRMSVFGQPNPVNEMIRKARGYKTLVLDLRGNGGGSLAALRALVGGCIGHEVVMAVEKRRDKDSAAFRSCREPRPGPCQGDRAHGRQHDARGSRTTNFGQTIATKAGRVFVSSWLHLRPRGRRLNFRPCPPLSISRRSSASRRSACSPRRF